MHLILKVCSCPVADYFGWAERTFQIYQITGSFTALLAFPCSKSSLVNHVMSFNTTSGSEKERTRHAWSTLMFRPRVTFTLLILESHRIVFVYREGWVTTRDNPSEFCLWDDSHARESPGPWRSCAYAVDDLWNLHVSVGSLLELLRCYSQRN